MCVVSNVPVTPPVALMKVKSALRIARMFVGNVGINPAGVDKQPAWSGLGIWA